jgi:DNA (cytosine-5)-methyltransferase 1
MSLRTVVCGYMLLNAAYYGVPQTRERMFLIAYRHAVTDQNRFPEPTHWVGLLSGYEDTRAVALKLLNQGSPLGGAHAYFRPPEASRKLPPAVTTEEAIGDRLPIYGRDEMAAGTLRRGARWFDVPLRYDGCHKVFALAKLMRRWPGFSAPDALLDHVIPYRRSFFIYAVKLRPGTSAAEIAATLKSMMADATAT